jgi:hypothetical protein
MHCLPHIGNSGVSEGRYIAHGDNDTQVELHEYAYLADPEMRAHAAFRADGRVIVP